MTMQILDDDLYLIDTNYLGGNIAAAYILKTSEGIAFIETGTPHTLPIFAQALKSLEVDWDEVRYVIPTHVHLDHAAGAGGLMAMCRNAKLIIHPRGARHMQDPSRLIAGTVSVYGQKKFDELYGEITPISPDRVIAAQNDFSLDFGEHKLIFLDTPGHAKHHFCIWDETTKNMFTGDTFGISYPELNTNEKIFIFPTTTPTQFDPGALIESIQKIMSFKPKRICLTHFGGITPTDEVISMLLKTVDVFSNFKAQESDDNRNDTTQQIVETQMMTYLCKTLTENGYNNEIFARQKLANDVNLNVQGILHWQATR